MTTEEARELLRANGFFTDNLWHISDVKDNYKCTDEEAQSILDGALTNGWIMEQIFATIKDLAEDKGLTKI